MGDGKIRFLIKIMASIRHVKRCVCVTHLTIKERTLHMQGGVIQ
jgi:hypothetical protein